MDMIAEESIIRRDKLNTSFNTSNRADKTAGGSRPTKQSCDGEREGGREGGREKERACLDVSLFVVKREGGGRIEIGL